VGIVIGYLSILTSVRSLRYYFIFFSRHNMN
jgi:hypothetical protein